MTNKQEPIRVIDILNDRELAMNAGSDRDIQIGDTLRVVGSATHEIKDPTTGEILGRVAAAKTVVEVYEVQPRFALARTFRSHRVNVGGIGLRPNIMDRIFEAPRWETRIDTLKGSTSVGATLNSEMAVKVGDILELATGGDVAMTTVVDDDVQSLGEDA